MVTSRCIIATGPCHYKLPLDFESETALHRPLYRWRAKYDLRLLRQPPPTRRPVASFNGDDLEVGKDHRQPSGLRQLEVAISLDVAGSVAGQEIPTAPGTGVILLAQVDHLLN